MWKLVSIPGQYEKNQDGKLGTTIQDAHRVWKTDYYCILLIPFFSHVSKRFYFTVCFTSLWTPFLFLLDWCCFDCLVRNSLVALLEAPCARVTIARDIVTVSFIFVDILISSMIRLLMHVYRHMHTSTHWNVESTHKRNDKTQALEPDWKSLRRWLEGAEAKNARKWSQCEPFFGASLPPWLAAWAGHGPGGLLCTSAHEWMLPGRGAVVPW